MCGRFVSTSSIEDLATCFDVDEVRTEPLPARWNVAPTQQVLAIAGRRTGPPGRALGRLRWGLVPSWATDLSVGATMINARAESIADKPAYRGAVARRRCVIPADAFYEWSATDRRPWAVRRGDRAPMALAGLWAVWRDANDPRAEPVRTCTIVTTAANDALAPIHHRMPVVLDRVGWERWLDPGVEDPADLEDLYEPAPAGWFQATRVGPAVGDVRRDGPGLLAPPTPEPGPARLF